MAANTSNDTVLQKYITTSGSLTNWTVSMWVKVDNLDTGTHQTLFSTYPSGGVEARILNTGQLNFYQYNGGYDWNVQSTAADFVIRDYNQWYHFLFYYDRNGQARAYVNGNSIGTVTVGTNLYRFNQSGHKFSLGFIEQGPGQYFAGSMTEVYFVDGLSLLPSVFGETTNGSWRPKSPSSIKSSISGSGGFGTNGFYLPFKKSDTAINDFTTAARPNRLNILQQSYTGSAVAYPLFHTGESKYNSSSVIFPFDDQKGWGNNNVGFLGNYVEDLSNSTVRNWSVEFWVKIQSGVTGNYQQLVCFNDSTAVAGDNVLLSRVTGTSFDLNILDVTTLSAGTFGSTSDDWDHYLYTWTGTKVITYLNGTLISETTQTSNPFSSFNKTFIQLLNEADASYGGSGSAGNPARGVLLDSVRIMLNGFPYLSDHGGRPRNILDPDAVSLYADTNSADLSLALPLNATASGISTTDYSGNNNTVTITSPIPWYTPVERQGAAYINGPFGSTSSVGSWTSPLRVEYNQHTASKAFNLSGSDWTIEGWFFSNRTTNWCNLIGCDNDSWEMIADWNSDGTTGIRIRRDYNGSGGDITFTVNTQYINKWCHFAVSQDVSANAVYLFINGELAGTTTVITFSDPATALRIGEMNSYTGWEPLNGGASEIKVYKGYCKYTSAFTPSTTSALKTDTDVPYVDDPYYDNLALYLPLRQIWSNTGDAQYGSVDTNDYSKYHHLIKTNNLLHGFLDNPTGGMMISNQTSNTALVTATGVDMSADFTISFWYSRSRPISGTGGIVNQALLSSYNYYTANYNGNWVLRQHSDTELAFYAYNGQADQEGGNVTIGNLAMGETTHITICRTGSNLRFFRDGAYCGVLTISKSLTDQSNGIYIGRANSNNPLHGTISNLRIYNSDIYDHDSFTPGRITNNNEWTRNGGTNYYTDNNRTTFVFNPSCSAAPIDLTGRSAIWLGGDVSISGDSKWRKSSYFFTNGLLGCTPIENTNLHPTDNWTLEMWVKPYITNERQVLWWGGSASGADATSHSFMEITASGTLNVGMYGGTYDTSTNTFTAGQWYHIALVKSSTTWTAYVNGTSWCTNTAPASNNTNSYIPAFCGLAFSTTYNFYGVLDSVRFTNDVLYTTSFTPGEIDSITQYTTNGGTSYSNFPNGGTCLLACAPDIENPGRDESTSTDVSNNGFSILNYTGTSNDGGVHGTFATLNPVDGTQDVSITNNNLDIWANPGAVLGTNISSVPSIFGVTSGKWYAEVAMPPSTNNYQLLGVSAVDLLRNNTNQNGTRTGEITLNHRTIYSDTTFDGAYGQVYTNDAVSNQATNQYTHSLSDDASWSNRGLDGPTTSLFGLLLDMDSRTFEIKRNGKSLSGVLPLPFIHDKVGATNQRIPDLREAWRYVAHPRGGGVTWPQKWNFGQGCGRSNSSYFSDENGVGKFQLKPPAGFLALNTANIYPEVRYYVDVRSSVFYLNGVANPAITLEPGYTYVFIQYDSTNAGHQLAFKDSGGNRVYSKVTHYGEPGDNRSKTTIRVEDGCTVDRYYCVAHGNSYGNTVTISTDTSGPTKYVKNPSNFFKSVGYAGDGNASKAITVGWQPDLVWIKDFDGGYHVMCDRVRGAGYYSGSNATDANVYTADTQAMFQSFDTNGFTVGYNASFFTNRDIANSSFSPYNYVAWCWDAGGTSVTNNDGGISSTVMANPACGFSISKWNHTTGTNTNVGHGLGQAPELVLFRHLDNTYNWDVYIADRGYTDTFILNSSTSVGRNVLHENVTTKTLPVTNSYTGSGNVIAYCFHSVPGISHVGTFTGNGDVDGVFVYCGFKPAFVMVKSLGSVGGNWVMWDNVRDEYNPVRNKLYADHNGAMNVSNPAGDNINANHVDFLSTGFKMRSSNTWTNGNGEEYLVLAFAESGIKTATGR